jgi:hypothetical protein
MLQKIGKQSFIAVDRVKDGNMLLRIAYLVVFDAVLMRFEVFQFGEHVLARFDNKLFPLAKSFAAPIELVGFFKLAQVETALAHFPNVFYQIDNGWI